MCKILIHSLVFSPDGVSTAYLYNDIAKRLKKEGYEVEVLTTTPHYNIVQDQRQNQKLFKRCFGLYYESDFDGIRVTHVVQKKFSNTFLRLLGFLYWHIMSFILALNIRNVDVILSPSPPLTIGLLNIIIAKFKHCKIIYNVQEIYPDILHTKNPLVNFILKKIERYVYNNSDAVTTIDEIFYEIISKRINNKNKLCIIPNFVDTKLYTPMHSITYTLDESLFPQNNSLKLMYAGNIGFAQDWETLLSLVESTKEYNIDYFVIGEGVMKPFLIEQKRKNRLNKLHIIPYQPRKLMPAIIAYSDIHFIFMRPLMDKDGFPSKIYTIMACAKPILICSGKDTPIINFLKNFDCAKLVTEPIQNKKIDALNKWITSIKKEELISMGKNGFNIIISNYCSDIVTYQYVQLIRKLI